MGAYSLAGGEGKSRLWEHAAELRWLQERASREPGGLAAKVRGKVAGASIIVYDSRLKFQPVILTRKLGYSQGRSKI